MKGRKLAAIGLLVVLIAILAACGGAPPDPPTATVEAPAAEATNTTAAPTAEPQPTDEPAPTEEPEPTDEPQPTAEAEPTAEPTAEAESEPAGDPVAGEANFNQTCVHCHGEGAVGIEGLGKDLTSSEFVGSLSDEELLAFIIEGRPVDHPDNTTGVAMPPRGGNPDFSDADLLDIIAYIRSLRGE